MVLPFRTAKSQTYLQMLWPRAPEFSYSFPRSAAHPNKAIVSAQIASMTFMTIKVDEDGIQKEDRRGSGPLGFKTNHARDGVIIGAIQANNAETSSAFR